MTDGDGDELRERVHHGAGGEVRDPVHDQVRGKVLLCFRKCKMLLLYVLIIIWYCFYKRSLVIVLIRLFVFLFSNRSILNYCSFFCRVIKYVAKSSVFKILFFKLVGLFWLICLSKHLIVVFILTAFSHLDVKDLTMED